MNDDTRWCEVCQRPVTMPHPHPATKMDYRNKIRRLAYVTMQGIVNGNVTASGVVARSQELENPLAAAYFVLNVVSYLPDDNELLIRNELGRVLSTL